MLCASSPSDFKGSPRGKYVSGRSWLCFDAGEAAVAGCVLWGQLRQADIRALLVVAPATHTAPRAPHAALIDASGVRSVEESLFALLGSYIEHHRKGLSETVTRLAIVRPGGLLATVAEGYFKVVLPPYPVRVFTGADAALEWLGASPSLRRALSNAVATARTGSTLSRQLRSLVTDELCGTATIAEVSRRMNLSPRTLQRRLQAEGTSFRAELRAARVTAAKLRLTESDASITEIAFAVGYASAAHLSAQFRRVLGECPSSWRQRRQSMTHSRNRLARS